MPTLSELRASRDRAFLNVSKCVAHANQFSDPNYSAFWKKRARMWLESVEYWNAQISEAKRQTRLAA